MIEKISIKRVYERPSSADGLRLLVDRIWPRGLSREKAQVDRWLKELAPSTELRKWFGHEISRWQEFRTRYREELSDNEETIEELRSLAKTQKLTLVYGARDTLRNQAIVLAEYLTGR